MASTSGDAAGTAASLKQPGPSPGRRVSRREWFRRAGLVVGAALMPRIAEEAEGGIRWPARSILSPLSVQDDPVTLEAREYATLDAVCGRLIPADANGPGAREARAARYIDRALSGALATSRETYTSGLAALDAHARSSRGAAFVDLSEPDQDAILAAVQDNRAGGFPGGNSTPFFNLLRAHTIQGTFSDPYYGGNAGFVGWDMIGYPGVRLAVTVQLMEMGVAHAPNHRSAYDFGMFTPGVF